MQHDIGLNDYIYSRLSKYTLEMYSLVFIIGMVWCVISHSLSMLVNPT